MSSHRVTHPSGRRPAWQLFLSMLGACLAWALASVPAYALPSFARQTGAACADCHVGAFGPQLTPFGMKFKMEGYTQGGGQGPNIPLCSPPTRT